MPLLAHRSSLTSLHAAKSWTTIGVMQGGAMYIALRRHCPAVAEGFFFWQNANFSLAARGLQRYIDGMIKSLSTPPSTFGLRESPDIEWCFTGCSEFWPGEQYGVILAAGHRHEQALLATKKPPTGGKTAATRTDTSQKAKKRYGHESSRIAANGHGPHRAVPTCRKHPRQGSNLQPSAPEAAGEFF